VKMLKQNTLSNDVMCKYASSSSFLLCYFVKRLEKSINRCKCIFWVICLGLGHALVLLKKNLDEHLFYFEGKGILPTHK